MDNQNTNQHDEDTQDAFPVNTNGNLSSHQNVSSSESNQISDPDLSKLPFARFFKTEEKRTSKRVKNSSRDDDSQILIIKIIKRQRDRQISLLRASHEKEEEDQHIAATDPIRSFECFDLCYFSFLCLSFLSRFVKKYLISLAPFDIYFQKKKHLEGVVVVFREEEEEEYEEDFSVKERRNHER